MKELPITPDNQLRNPRWSYLYAYNLKTLRDVFVYCAKKKRIKESVLYYDMASDKIPPPKNVWITKGIKRKERLRLEYVHAAEYLGFICRKDGYVMPNLSEFRKEKNIILKENVDRTFKSTAPSPHFTEKEKEALLRLVTSYERAKDFLWWFMDFSKFTNINDFSLEDFKKHAKPIYVLGKTISSERGSEVLRKFGDNRRWKIPTSYIRLANFVFPSWFHEIGLIGKTVEFSEFSKDQELWHMLYPLRMSSEEFLKMDGASMLEEMFLSKNHRRSLWIPRVIYDITLKYGCPVEAVKTLLKRLYNEDYEHFYLERTSLQIMKKRAKYEESYIKADGFYRSTIILKRRAK
ncbi:MAG: hypothetical protein JRI72_02235 [Deltaproteobacteria bacterium]|nr:hypothetical protein [Deltaproteobacteria bacterium]